MLFQAVSDPPGNIVQLLGIANSIANSIFNSIANSKAKSKDNSIANIHFKKWGMHVRTYVHMDPLLGLLVGAKNYPGGI